MVVYVYNFSVLPLRGSPLVTFYFKNVIAFLNLALAAFVLASVAARFVFPSFSMEGRALWLIKGAPVPARRIWWAKFWVRRRAAAASSASCWCWRPTPTSRSCRS